MRRFFAIIFLLSAAGSARAQQQENKLLDRLLRPNMALENSAQNQKFTADARASNKPANVKNFYLHNNFRSETFADQRKFESQSFSAGRSNFSDKTANPTTRSQFVKAGAIYPTQTSRWTKTTSSAGGKAVVATQFAGKREFVEQGKSQKSLNKQNPPMTIEQVRELLNKNK